MLTINCFIVFHFVTCAASCNLFAGHVSASEERVTVSQEELQDLKGVWAELSKIWQQIDELKERPWMSVQPRKVYHGRPYLQSIVLFNVCELYK